MIKSRARTQAKIVTMAHQKVSIAHGRKNSRVFDASDPGTGKTFVRIMLFAERRRKRGGCALVLAPKSLLVTAWANDFAKFAPDMKVSVATAANREAAFAVDADVYVTNVDAVKWLVKKKKAFFAKFSELIVDESTAYKHHTSQRSKAAFKVASHFEYRACLTGTPTGNTITDIWHQVALLDGGARLGPSYFAFRNTVSTPVQVGRKSNMVNWVDKDGAEEAVFGLLTDIVVRHKLDDCADIPEQHVYALPYKMTAKQRKAYDTLFDTQLLSMATGKLTAINAAAVTTKLQQAASGAVYDNDRVVHELEDARAEMIIDLVEVRPHSLVFFFWQHQLQQMTRIADARSLKYAVLDGSTPDKDRASIVAMYQTGKYDVVFAHPVTTAHGVTMTKGRSIIWPSPTSNLEWWKQGNARQRRLGQRFKTEVIVVIAEDSVEERMYYEMLMPKDRRMTNLLDLFEQNTKEAA
jgi:SNF2 family DNA or RNA helicase